LSKYLLHLAHAYAVLVGEFLVNGRHLPIGICGPQLLKIFHYLNFAISDAKIPRPVGRPLLAGYVDQVASNVPTISTPFNFKEIKRLLIVLVGFWLLGPDAFKGKADPSESASIERREHLAQLIGSPMHLTEIEWLVPRAPDPEYQRHGAPHPLHRGCGLAAARSIRLQYGRATLWIHEWRMLHPCRVDLPTLIVSR
jgi:hypothetical protein